MNNRILVLLFGVAAIIAIATILTFTIIWIGFPADNPKDSYKDALSISGSFFGGLATFGAAVVAAYLFNDWRDQKKYEISSALAIECLDMYLKAKSMLFFYLFQHKLKTERISFKQLDDFFVDTQNKLATLNEVLNRVKLPPINDEIINSFFKNNYQNIAKKINSDAKLLRLNENELNAINDDFLNKLKLNDQDKLAKELLNVLNM